MNSIFYSNQNLSTMLWLFASYVINNIHLNECFIWVKNYLTNKSNSKFQSKISLDGTVYISTCKWHNYDNFSQNFLAILYYVNKHSTQNIKILQEIHNPSFDHICDRVLDFESGYFKMVLILRNIRIGWIMKIMIANINQHLPIAVAVAKTNIVVASKIKLGEL